MMDDMFFGLEAFRGKDSLSEQLRYLRARMTKLLNSGCTDGAHLRAEFEVFERAFVGCTVHARRLEEEAQMIKLRLEEEAQMIKLRLPRWMHSKYRGGV